jgi:hypothetical protein
MKDQQHEALSASLNRPFPAADVEWRMQACGKKSDGTIWARVLCYITARAVMERLDEVFGPFGWEDSYEPVEIERSASGIRCRLTAYVGGQKITREDVCEPSDIEPLKGAYSGAMKRAAVKFGIGRYLYNIEEAYAEITKTGAFRGTTKDKDQFRWNPPQLPEWALPATPAPASAAQQQPQQQAAPKTTQQASQPQTGSPVSSNWRLVVVPKFVKKYAGQTMAEMAPLDIMWWAEHYEPKPFKGAIDPKDVAFKAALLVAAKDVAPKNEEQSQDEHTQQSPDDDVPF